MQAFRAPPYFKHHNIHGPSQGAATYNGQRKQPINILQKNKCKYLFIFCNSGIYLSWLTVLMSHHFKTRDVVWWIPASNCASRVNCSGDTSPKLAPKALAPRITGWVLQVWYSACPLWLEFRLFTTEFALVSTTIICRPLSITVWRSRTRIEHGVIDWRSFKEMTHLQNK